MSGNDDWQYLARDLKRRVREGCPFPVVHAPFGVRPLVGEPVIAQPPIEHTQPAKSPVGKAKIKRIEDVLEEAARDALTRAERFRRKLPRTDLAEIFESAVVRACDRVMNASKVNQKIAEEQASKLETERYYARKKISDDLKATRKRLRELKETLKNAEHDVARMHAAICSNSAKDNYPLIPPPSLVPDKDGNGLPMESGIYFLWNGNIVTYVGKSIKLNNRLKLGGHHRLKDHHRISYVLVEKRLLTWAECYYIGVLKPMDNFGQMASHNRE